MTTKGEKLGLESIAPPDLTPSDEPDPKTQKEEDAWQAAAEKQHAALKNQSLEQNIRERKKYATCLFALVCVWLACMMILLICSGAKRVPVGIVMPNLTLLTIAPFELSDKVLIALITGTTVDLIGLFFIVAKYLFRAPTAKNHRTNGQLQRSRNANQEK